MKKSFKILTLIIVVSFFGTNGLLSDLNPSIAYAQNETTTNSGGLNETTGLNGNQNNTNTNTNTNVNTSTTSAATGSGVSVKLKNPLGTINSIPQFVKAVLDIVMKVGVPLVALAIIYTGYLFIAAQGKPEELKKAKDALVYVFIGSMILLGAYVIAESIIGTINAIRGQ